MLLATPEKPRKKLASESESGKEGHGLVNVGGPILYVGVLVMTEAQPKSGKLGGISNPAIPSHSSEKTKPEEVLGHKVPLHGQ